MYGLWLVVYSLWFMLRGLWFMVYGLWFMVYDSLSGDLRKPGVRARVEVWRGSVGHSGVEVVGSETPLQDVVRRPGVTDYGLAWWNRL